MNDVLEPQTPQVPPVGEQTPQQPIVDPEKEQLQKKINELEIQKQHWRDKYDRDITSVVPQPITPETPSEPFSDEGKMLQGQIDLLNNQIAKRDILDANPILKDKWQEFQDYCQLPENQGMKMSVAVKSFMTETGLLEPKRPGLERPTGGPRVPPKQGMTWEEFDKLRDTNFKLYQEMLSKGQVPTA